MFELELAGAFVVGIVFTLVMLAVLIPKVGPWLIRKQMQRAMLAATIPQVKMDTIVETTDLPKP